MKICPRCQKTYTDESLNFCLEDGSVLTQASAQPPPPTAFINPPAQTQPQQSMPSQPSAQPQWNTAPQQYAQPPKKSSKTWIWVLVILGGVVLLCGGGFVGLIILGASQTDPSLANGNPLPSPLQTVNKSTTTSPANSTRTSVTPLDFNMFVHDTSTYGATGIEGDELTVKASPTAAYYVLTAPDDYTTEDADTRITLRNTTGAICPHGYGLVFHSDPTPLQKGYAFLIDAKRGMYSVVHHEPNKETPVIKWTASTDIHSGTAENTLEVRDHDGTVDLYINDDKVTSIKNIYGFSGGVPGIYTGNGVKIAFKNFEIRK